MRVSDQVMKQLQLILPQEEFTEFETLTGKRERNVPRVVVLVASQMNACDYYRAYMVMKELESREAIVSRMVHSFSAMDAYQADLLLCFRPKDRGLLQYATDPAAQNCFLMADYDDDVFSVPSANFLEPNFGEPDKQASLAITQRVTQLTVSTRRLQSLLSSTQPKCSIIPNCIDFSAHSKLLQYHPKKPNDRFRIGWAGTFTHTEDVMGGKQPFLGALRRLMRKYRDIEVVFWGLCPEAFKHEFYGRVAYKRAVQLFQYMGELAKLNLDLIVYPLINHQFNYSKSNIRWLESSMVHVPVVASNIPSYTEIGEELCFTVPFTEEGWFEKLEYAYLNQDEMRERAVKSREVVKEYWSIQAMWPAWAKVFEKAAQGEHLIQDFTPPTIIAAEPEMEEPVEEPDFTSEAQNVEVPQESVKDQAG